MWNGTWHGPCTVVWLDEDAVSVVVCGGASRQYGVLQQENKGVRWHIAPLVIQPLSLALRGTTLKLEIEGSCDIQPADADR